MNTEDLNQEESITWLEDIDKLDYVRQILTTLPTRKRAPRRSRISGRLVGYGVLKATAPAELDNPGMFMRRVFTLASHDRDSQPDGVYKVGAPMEAVDPRTVAAGVPGRLTDRAWGRAQS